MSLRPRPRSNNATRAVFKKRRTRTVYRTTLRRRAVVVKCYDDWRESVSERDVMRSYKNNRHLVRFYRWYVRHGRGFIVMEYVRGETINDMIARRGAIPPAKVMMLALNILKGLDVLHRRRFVHGDLHGDNVIVTNYETGATKIIDLQHGVKLNHSGKARAKRTLAAPPLQLAPESCRRFIDQRYDIYGVGFMCACMLAGRRFTTAEGLAKWVRTDTPLWNVVKTALHPDPRERYYSARDMMRALRSLTTGEGIGGG